MKWRSLTLLAVLGTACLHASTARADDEPESPANPPTIPTGQPTGPGQTKPIVEPPSAPPVPSDARTPFEQISRPPTTPVPVPNPSPVVLGGKPTPQGQAATPLEWKRARFSKLDFGIMLAAGATTLATAIVKPSSKHSIGPTGFDQDIRKAIGIPSTQVAYVYRDASDTGLSLAVTWPFFVDAFITAWWYRGSRDVAEQMALLGLETMAISGAVQGITNVLVSRERPYGPTCGQPGGLPGNAQDCEGFTHYRSFFSGHSAFSFTGASLICFEHTQLELLGGPWDALSCVGGYAVAAATATFRVAGNEHYPSDVLTGAAVGTLIGWGVPLLHLKHANPTQIRTTGGLVMEVIPSGTGAQVVGLF